MNEKKPEDLVNRLKAVAARGLCRHFDEKTDLFDRILADGSTRRENPDLLLVHSLISLLGISRHKEKVAIDFGSSLERALETVIRAPWEIRCRSLMLWLLAKERDTRVFEILAGMKKRQILTAGTMETAWLVTGLAYAYEITKSKSILPELHFALKVLHGRFVADSGLFLHRKRENAPWDYRYHIGNFADQIYPIYALSLCYRIIGDLRSVKMAERCAARLIFLQGGMGQWWWHYNAPKGAVIQKYPVFSVHQDSMAPFSLTALSRISGTDYTAPAEKGLSWITGNNELKEEMINPGGQYVKRGIERKKKLRYLCNISLLPTFFNLNSKIRERFDTPRHLMVMDWEHSYHLGWILYTYRDKMNMDGS